MVSALQSFFKRAVTQGEESKNNASAARVEYDTFEQVTAKKFDTRIQITFQKLKWST